MTNGRRDRRAGARRLAPGFFPVGMDQWASLAAEAYERGFDPASLNPRPKGWPRARTWADLWDYRWYPSYRFTRQEQS